MTSAAERMQALIDELLRYSRVATRVPPYEWVDLGGVTRDVDSYLEVAIADNSIGFEPDQSERVFGLFERFKGRSGVEGNGLGFAICHKIVELHGGLIVAESTPGAGSTFTIRIPMPPPDSATEQSRWSPRSLDDPSTLSPRPHAGGRTTFSVISPRGADDRTF